MIAIGFLAPIRWACRPGESDRLTVRQPAFSVDSCSVRQSLRSDLSWNELVRGRLGHHHSDNSPGWLRRRRARETPKPNPRNPRKKGSRHVNDNRIKWDTRIGTFARPREVEPGLFDRPLAPRISLFMSGIWLITLFGAAVRFAILDHPMRYDESYNYLNFVSRGLTDSATHYTPNNHIFHTLLVRLATGIFGTAPHALRLPAFLAGVLLIPATAWLAWTLSRRSSVALISALAVCCSSPLIEYSASARGYSLLALLTVLTVIVVRRAMESPTRRFRWVLGGLTGAIGIYTIPVMVLPLLGLGFATLVHGLRRPKDSPQRHDVLNGILVASIVCVLLAGILYAPVFVVGGVRPFADSRRMAYDILGQQAGSVSAVLQQAWALWTRHLSIAAALFLTLGAVVYLVRAIQTPSVDRWLPLAMMGVSVCLIVMSGAPLPSRGWLFALPLFFICCTHGIRELLAREPETILRRAFSGSVMVVLAAIPFSSLANVLEAPYLCAEPRGLVEVEETLDDCRAFGPERCALVAPYSPATTYYMIQKKMPPLSLPTSAQVERVYIVADDKRPLDELWHAGAEGFAAFDPPRLVRKQRLSTVYFAERAARSALR